MIEGKNGPRGGRGRSSMLYPVANYLDWANRYTLSTEPQNCSECGKPQYPNIPFATSTWRGLQAPVHECGPSHQLIRAREVDPAKLQEWKTVYEVMQAELEAD